ncbi:MAG: ribonuclease [Acidimicrobiaceae bacterium]|nr:ribonuclease [Acidimicrobiaceae bacterium]
MNRRRPRSRYHLEVPRRGPDLLARERALVERGEVVVGIDEVGRGALAGPLTVGAVVLTHATRAPKGLTDSKLLTSREREALVGPLEAWATNWSLGSVSSNEIDRWGLRLALAVAATRAIDGLSVSPTHALLDGPFNLLDAPLRLEDQWNNAPELRYASLSHTTLIKGDRLCASIAAASVLAKVHRDRTMVELADEFPPYGWADNKGYGAPQHRRALFELGPCCYHRVTWKLNVPGELDVGQKPSEPTFSNEDL